MKVLITGGAGFLGRGILRQAPTLGWDITVFSRDETKQQETQRRYPHARFVLGDVRDTDKLIATAAGHDAIIHGAAMKYIPEAELNAAECISVNIGGSQSVAVAARRAGVHRVVGISTDKAVQPVNIYGCSKMAMERLFAETSTVGTQFNCVRYGNVIGSTGSVIPFFQRQHEEEGRVTVTDPNMTRFWMGIAEAIELIQIALTTTRPGSIIIPFVRAMKMGDVVKAVVGDVKVEIIGVRPGEKLHERLLHQEESVRVLRTLDYFELLPPGSPLEPDSKNMAFSDPFTLSSQNPHHWMEPQEMRDLIQDAAEV